MSKKRIFDNASTGGSGVAAVGSIVEPVESEASAKRTREELEKASPEHAKAKAIFEELLAEAKAGAQRP